MNMKILPSRFVIVLLLVFCSCSCQDRMSLICSRFGINLQRLRFDVVEKSEHWYPNGDGELFVRLSVASVPEDKLNEISNQMTSSGAIELPMLNQHAILMSGECANYVRHLDTGLYLIDVDRDDTRNYSLIVYNKAKKELIIQMIVY